MELSIITESGKLYTIFKHLQLLAKNLKRTKCFPYENDQNTKENKKTTIAEYIIYALTTTVYIVKQISQEM